MSNESVRRCEWCEQDRNDVIDTRHEAADVDLALCAECRDADWSTSGLIRVGDRFDRVMPYGRDTVVVEALLDRDRVAVRRSNGARQSFPIATLLDPWYWERTTATPGKETS